MANLSMVTPTSTQSASAMRNSAHLNVQRRLRRSLDAFAAFLALAIVAAMSTDAARTLRPLGITANAAFVIVLIASQAWIAARWTLHCQPTRGILYAALFPTLIVVAIVWHEHRPPTWLPPGWLIATYQLAFLSIGILICRWLKGQANESVSLSPVAASRRAGKFWALVSSVATTVVASVFTVALLAFAFANGHGEGAWAILYVWTIPAILVGAITFWSASMAFLYYYRDTTPRPPYWRTWNGVRVLTFAGTLVVGVLFVLTRPYFAAHSLAAAGAEVDDLESMRPITTRHFFGDVTADADNFDPAALRHVRGLYGHVWLYLTSATIDDSSIKHLADSCNIGGLELASPNLTDEAIPTIRTLRMLEGLRITGTKITGVGLGTLEELDRLHGIEIDGAPLSKQGIESLTSLRTLKNLTLANLPLDAADVRLIVGMPALKGLRLENVSLASGAIESLAGSTRIKTLILIRPRIALVELQLLQQRIGPTELDFSGMPIDDDALKTISAILSVVTLSLANTNVRGPGLIRLLRLGRLKELDLCGTKVDDPAIMTLASLPLDVDIILRDTPTTRFGRSLLQFERARHAWTEGRIDDDEFEGYENEFHNDESNNDYLGGYGSLRCGNGPEIQE